VPNNAWTAEHLLDHLQKAVYLELWTIPLYLTAAYSLQVPGTSARNPPALQVARSHKNPKRSREQLAFNHIYSIAVQEMLHIELAANLFNALFAARGHAPKFTGEWAPRYGRFPPWIGVKDAIELGAVNDAQMALLAAVETPEPKADPAPDGPHAVYDSIGQFYKSIEQGIDQLWDQLYDPSADHRQKSEFANPQFLGDDYTGFSATVSGDRATARNQADQMIEAIIGQGEGSRGSFIAPNLRPADPCDEEGRFSHFARFRDVQKMLKYDGPLSTYLTTGSEGLVAAQQQLDAGFTSLLVALERGFAGDADLDLGPMWNLPGQIVGVWAAGGVPTFRAGTTGAAS
jgi:hypothetical protein